MPYTANDFYNAELNRLNEKQKNADAIMNSQDRLAVLNDSYRKRYAKYVQMLMVLILAYIVYLAVIILQKNIPTIPQIAVDVVVTVLLLLVFLYLFSAFQELYSRNLLNYDELDVKAYDDSTDMTNANNKSYDKGTLGLNLATCIGNDCCPEGYTYDNVTNRCSVPVTTQPPSSGAPSSGAPSSGARNGFTTLEYEQVDSAYTSKSFNSPDLKRAPSTQNVNPLKEVTSLNYSNF